MPRNYEPGIFQEVEDEIEDRQKFVRYVKHCVESNWPPWSFLKYGDSNILRKPLVAEFKVKQTVTYPLYD